MLFYPRLNHRMHLLFCLTFCSNVLHSSIILWVNKNQSCPHSNTDTISFPSQFDSLSYCQLGGSAAFYCVTIRASLPRPLYSDRWQDLYAFLIWLLVIQDKWASQGKIWFQTCATCKMQTSSLETASSDVRTIQAVLSSSGRRPTSLELNYSSLLCHEWLLHWFISKLWTSLNKLNQQLEFNGNKQADRVASGCVNSLDNGHAFRWMWMWLGVCSQCIHLVFSPSMSRGPSSSQHHHGISRYAGKLEGKCPVKQHDDDAEHPFKDGWRVL